MSPITHQTLSPTSTLGHQPKNICLFSGNFRFLQSFPFQHPSISLSALMSSYWSSHQHNNKLSPWTICVPKNQSLESQLKFVLLIFSSEVFRLDSIFAIYMTTNILLTSKNDGHIIDSLLCLWGKSCQYFIQSKALKGHKARRAQWPNFLASCQRVRTILHNAQWPNFPFAISGPPHRKFSLQLFLFPAPLPRFSHLSTFFENISFQTSTLSPLK